jgi:hypothetical protein
LSQSMDLSKKHDDAYTPCVALTGEILQYNQFITDSSLVLML